MMGMGIQLLATLNLHEVIPAVFVYILTTCLRKLS
jgi:hypothetical protein